MGTRFLVMHDYGMGGMWWWITADSAREIRETFAEVEVVEDPNTVEAAESWRLIEIACDTADIPADLRELRDVRIRQRALPGFGALADRTILYVKRYWDGADGVEAATYYSEVDSDGRRLRQVEDRDAGPAIRSTVEDWAFNPPLVDLYDPEWVEFEIGRDEFEAAWARARYADEP
ncbi:hypothetical protein [Nocardia arthritidis]|uniref:Uncharacterized protein n=1 Tax=Nocardia arthritidis TaxID=228602 RepID=A0A6G9YNH3_9NOCA|nr:hypothetical protein [Nocardia arthritidis]QIS14473.1 hypothetical protein F5544_33185 [Nocardia arthritidis]